MSLKYNRIEFELGTITDNEVIFLKKGNKEYVLKTDKTLKEVPMGSINLMDSAVTQDMLDNPEGIGNY